MYIESLQTMLNLDLFPIAKGVGCELGKFDHYLVVSGNGRGGGGGGCRCVRGAILIEPKIECCSEKKVSCPARPTTGTPPKKYSNNW